MNKSHLNLTSSFSSFSRGRVSTDLKSIPLQDNPSRLTNKVTNPNSKAYPSALRKVVELYGASDKNFDVSHHHYHHYTPSGRSPRPRCIPAIARSITSRNRCRRTRSTRSWAACARQKKKRHCANKWARWAFVASRATNSEFSTNATTPAPPEMCYSCKAKMCRARNARYDATWIPTGNHRRKPSK